MLTGLYLDLAIVGIGLFILGYYFNHREAQIHRLASSKIKELREKFIRMAQEKKLEETEELKKLKSLAAELEDEYKKIRVVKRSLTAEHEAKKQSYDPAEVEHITKRAKENAQEIIADARRDAEEEAKDYLEDKKKEVETKIVDLVIAITKKVLKEGLSYDEHKAAIEAAFAEMEGKLK